MDLIEAGCARLGAQIEAQMAEGALRSLLVSGLVGGVGGVLVFLPQILILFFFIGILEDCGYMARAAYLMDRFMSRVGLSGKSFIPMLAAFACAIPGIMAARVIENDRDRLTTILVAPLMTCSARLPVFALLIAAFIPDEPVLGFFDLRGLTLFGLYALGILTAVVVALLLKRTLLRGETPPFVIELPSYKWPSVGTVLHRVLERGWLLALRRHDHPGRPIPSGSAYYRTRRVGDRQPHLSTSRPWMDPAGEDLQPLAAELEAATGEFHVKSWLG